MRLFIASWLTQAPPLFDTPVSIANSRTFEQVRLFIASCKHNSFLLSVAPLVYTPFNFSKGQGQNLWFPSPSLRRIYGDLFNGPCHGFEAILTRRQKREKLQCLYGNLMSNNFRRTAVLKKYLLNCKPKLYS